jgi:5'-3' exonuclease
MLQWILFYYVRGCDDWWACYPYASAPLLEDLAQSVAIVLHEDVATTQEWRSQPVTQQAQLMYVLPQAKMRCLRKQAQEPKQEQRKQEQVDETYAFHWMGCRYFWEAHLEQHDAEDKLMACCKKYT